MKKQNKIKTWAFFMRLGNRCGCHQRPDRSFFIGKWQFPICGRCTGILLGQIIAVILYSLKIRVPTLLGFLFLIIMFIDWFIQYKKIKDSTNIRRLITGTLAGIAQISIILNFILWIINLIN